eukprot:m.243142 g.243142  ORF g.243142 m.243142 type:complete len:156 (+) comp15338_c1_seq16:134-601(+)
MRQYPRAFEFNESFLIAIHDCIHSCKFGTFLGNSPAARDEAQVASKTVSVWTFLYARLDEYRNEHFAPTIAPMLLQVDLRPQHFKLWRNMYCQWDLSMQPMQSISAASHHTALRLEHERLRLLRAKDIVRMLLCFCACWPCTVVLRTLSLLCVRV